MVEKTAVHNQTSGENSSTQPNFWRKQQYTTKLLEKTAVHNQTSRENSSTQPNFWRKQQYTTKLLEKTAVHNQTSGENCSTHRKQPNFCKHLVNLSYELSSEIVLSSCQELLPILLKDSNLY